MIRIRRRNPARITGTVYSIGALTSLCVFCSAAGAADIAQDGYVAYLNNDPTECCCPDYPYCQECEVPSMTNAVFALVVTGVTDVSGSCCMPGGRGCRDITRNACELFGGAFNVANTCAGGPVACPTQE